MTVDDVVAFIRTQMLGVAGAERERIREVYFARFPGGRDRLAWEGITHVRVRPHWLRYSDFNQSPPLIVEAASDPSGALVVR